MRTCHLNVKEESQKIQVHLKYTENSPNLQIPNTKKKNNPATRPQTDPETQAHSKSINSQNSAKPLEKSMMMNSKSVIQKSIPA